MVNKLVVFVSATMAFLMISFVIAQTVGEDIEKNIEKILKENVSNITEVDPSSDEINIKNATVDNNIAIYRAELEGGKHLFVITFSNEGFQKISQIYHAVSFLSFGMNEERNSSAFLKMSSGVEGGLENGYVMVRSGSITGISTNLEVIQGKDSGSVQILIYKNGERIGLGNMIEASSSGVKKDYDIQSRNIVNFNQGDVISVYAENSDGVSFGDLTTIVEISTSAN